MELIVKEDKICPYVDLPLQHISQSVLERMNRRDSEDDVRHLMKKLCSHGRKLTLRSTFIVGFPGETEEEFRELCDFVKETEFDDVASLPTAGKTGHRQPVWTIRYRKKSKKNGIISSCHSGQSIGTSQSGTGRFSSYDARRTGRRGTGCLPGRRAH